ncbi:MAG TPA: hypothetical protein VJ464_16800 [Blastocatellia bacterium]|nr:hypothetical protein [Blastocatellia bacterium]
MIGAIIESLEKSFGQSKPGRLLYVFFLLVLTGIGLYIYNRATGYTYYIEIDKRISALERLQALEEKQVPNSPSLGPIYNAIITELNPPIREATRPKKSLLAFESEELIKFFGATFTFILLFFVFLFETLRGKRGTDNPIGGAIFMTFLFGIPAVLIPTWGSPWVNAGIYTVAQLVFFRLMYVTERS